MRYKNKEGNVSFTVTPNEMYDKAMAMDTKLNTRKVLGWILRKIVSDNKQKVDGEWEINPEGFTPKTWISRDLGITENAVSNAIKELEARNVIETDALPKTFHPDGRYYTRDTTYCKISDPKVWALGKIRKIKCIT